nr:hypothetical protein Iba_chr13eCG9750 [Ipomoea batatas]
MAKKLRCQSQATGTTLPRSQPEQRRSEPPIARPKKKLKHPNLRMRRDQRILVKSPSHLLTQMLSQNCVEATKATRCLHAFWEESRMSHALGAQTSDIPLLRQTLLGSFKLHSDRSSSHFLASRCLLVMAMKSPSPATEWELRSRQVGQGRGREVGAVEQPEICWADGRWN